jgi:choline-sulfatase
MGAYGNKHAITPNMDRLAENGTLFSNAYTNCPLCCPARASLATGRYVHDIGYWNNSFGYNGTPFSWTHRLRETGMRIDALGKLHYRSDQDDNGFNHEYNTLHLVDGIGDLAGNLRHDTTIFNKRNGVLKAGVGESMYTEYDSGNTDKATSWIHERNNDDKPWALFFGIALPHPPNLVPQHYFDLYKDVDLPMPPQWRKEDWPDHAGLDYARRFYNFEEPLPESAVQNFQKAYYGAVSYVDDLIGRLMAELESSGSMQDTLIIYLSDHGEDLGARGLFGKFTMYDEAMKVPLIISGPGIQAGKKVDTPVSLIDIYPTILDEFNIPAEESEKELPGESLSAIAARPSEDRMVFGEYHAGGSHDALYMIRDKTYKYIHYIGEVPMLYDMQSNATETVNLAMDPAYKALVKQYEKQLRYCVDPEKENEQAKEAQREKVINAGGEEAVKAKGTFDNSPPPGITAEYMHR